MNKEEVIYWKQYLDGLVTAKLEELSPDEIGTFKAHNFANTNMNLLEGQSMLPQSVFRQFLKKIDFSGVTEAIETAQELCERTEELLQDVDELKNISGLFYTDQSENKYPFYILITPEDEAFANVELESDEDVLALVSGILDEKAKGALHIIDLQVPLRGLNSCRYLFIKSEAEVPDSESAKRVSEYLWSPDGYYFRTVAKEPQEEDVVLQDWTWRYVGIVPTEQILDEAVTLPKLHHNVRKMIERVVATISVNDAGGTIEIEIDGTEHVLEIQGKGSVTTYGNPDGTPIVSSAMTSKKIYVDSIEQPSTAVGIGVVCNYTIPTTGDNAIKQYSTKFEMTYNGVTKSAESFVNVNLRKYFGFFENAPVRYPILPTVPGTLLVDEFPSSASHFSNSVGCTITIPASGTGFEYVFLAVPDNMSITRIKQPDALNAPLEFALYDTVDRIIDEEHYTYKLYRSKEKIDCSAAKRLTIK